MASKVRAVVTLYLRGLGTSSRGGLAICQSTRGSVRMRPSKP